MPQAYAECAQNGRMELVGHFLQGSFLCGAVGGVHIFEVCPPISQILGLPERRRRSPGWHDLDGNLPTWVVQGCLRVGQLTHPCMETLSTHDGFHHSEVWLVRDIPCPAALPGQPFDFKYVAHASCTSALEWVPRACRVSSSPLRSKCTLPWMTSGWRTS